LTDQADHNPGTGIFRIAVGDNARAVILELLDFDGIERVVVLPSSLARRDPLAGILRQAMREAGVESHLQLPGNPVAGLSRLVRSGGQWRTVTTAPPDRDERMVRLPAAILDAEQLWVVTDVDAVSGRGPYALDLLSRYVDPVSRVRNLGSRERVSLPVEVNLARTPDRYVVMKDCGAFVLGVVTSDPIAAELLALAMADEDLTRDHRLTGPWEDPMVQRATELDLGVRVPQDMQVNVSGSRSEAIDEVIVRIFARIGVRWP
jgi:hypothetical protein